MTATSIMEETENQIWEREMPGTKLAAVREKIGYSREYVAEKLHLRVHVIELLEMDEYSQLPEAVFIKGYLRSYAKLLNISPEPFIEDFKQLQLQRREKTLEQPLWQSRKEPYKAEHAVRWLTLMFAVGASIAVAIWWHKNKDSQQLFSASVSQNLPANNKLDTEVRLTDLSKMRSLLSSTSQFNSQEAERG